MEKETMEIDVDLRDLMFDLESYVPVISAAKLMNQPFSPTEYVAKGLLPNGLSILGGAPKIGKSWLVLDLCMRFIRNEAINTVRRSHGFFSIEETIKDEKRMSAL